ncbi:glycosyltransferase [Rhabdobacter roseus]|uniref:Cellulose synthase/poly-beta-1,6-N-acetylglucosamine synthase-like glycosyltransferase n=1 Tax=Rhabdobacter roseus TaxID=1655419 RepID=A0A840TZI7_9BACT|nr:cellulose synthase family protein [Rhabdobacter roseus]MBB5285049.1 cellulose synthase/poly-beta-1,6-N-acetylglucosamine synthase-like glycosyltransferase [Rhabdobacter roseus]
MTEHILQYIVLILYLLPLLFILAYSLAQLSLVLLYWKEKRNENAEPVSDHWPPVTVQLPVYNERYVVERLIEAVMALDYPRELLQIQLLDDSTDDTVELIARKVLYYQAQGFTIQHIRRRERTGFKAGALAHGLDTATGEFIAIFDADFIPAPPFLRRTLPHFTNPTVGVVQSRWSHLNEDYSWITRLQAFGLDAHFTIEQVGRSAGGYFINFNGTAGLWRKATIADAGGWSADTLTEDLDLSYRAQQRGWRFVYLENLLSPAELPVTMPAVKSQQYRWTKGAAECARKNLGAVWRDRQLPLATRLHASFHLLNSSVFIATLLIALLSVPMLWLQVPWPWLGLFQVSMVILAVFYWSAYRQKGTFGTFVITFPAFITMMLGLSLHNAVAVLEGYLGRKTPFVRTPKFNVTSRTDAWRQSTYHIRRVPPLTWVEWALTGYFALGLVMGVLRGQYGAFGFHLLLVLGYGSVAYYSVRHSLGKA